MAKTESQEKILPIMRTSEVCEFFGVCQKTLTRWGLRQFKRGLYHRDDIDAFIRTNRPGYQRLINREQFTVRKKYNQLETLLRRKV